MEYLNGSKKLLQAETCVHYLWSRIVLRVVKHKSLGATMFKPFISALCSMLKSGKFALNLQLARAFIKAVGMQGHCKYA